MEMPAELSRLIQDFARPRTRLNWRSGGAFPSELFWRGINSKYFGDMVDLAQTAQSAEEYEFMLQESGIPEWF